MYKKLLLPVLAAAIAVPAVAYADDLDLSAEAAPSAVSWSGDLLLRQDWVRSWRPDGDNESRLLARLRYGPTWQIDDQWTLGAALKVNESSIGNEYLVDYNDNQRPRDLALDTLYMSYAPTEYQLLEAGKDALPLNLSRMVWDPNLRPAGFTYAAKEPFGDDSVRLVAGAYLAQYLSGDQSRIGALQADLRFDDPGAVHPEFVLSYLHFTHLDDLVLTGEDRGNPTLLGPGPCTGTGCLSVAIPDRFADQYELADLQFALHVDGDVPFRMLLDADKNLGAVAGHDRGARAEFALGDGNHAGGNELGLAVERMQQSAVLGAFNSDEWWFHAGSHGVMLWYAYGWSDRVRLQASWFHEQPDGSWHHWNRVLLDLAWQL